MSEELIQRNLVEAPEKMGDWNFYNIGATTLKAVAVDDYSGNVSPVVTASYLITDANNNSTVNTIIC